MNPSNFPCVTIAITTYNRAKLLEKAIKSALNQDYENLEIQILDNASTDDTQSLMKTFNDKRIKYFRSQTNIGMLNNWNRAIELNSNPYLVILQDDDILLPDYVKEVVGRLKNYPNAGFGFSAIAHIDMEGTPVAFQDISALPDEKVVDGFAYLQAAVGPKGLFIHASSIMFRTSALKKFRIFDSAHAKQTFVTNMQIKLASEYEVVPVHKVLAHVRLHEEQDSKKHWRSNSSTGPLGVMAERIDALAFLLRSHRAEDPKYREWLMERLLRLNATKSFMAYSLLPNMYWSWEERLQASLKEINSVIPESEAIILIDEDQWATDGNISGRNAIPFSSREGIYWGSPANDSKAIEELNHHLQMGIKYVVVGWPAFWWLEHYSAFNTYLEETGKKIYKSSRIIIFRFNGIV